MGVGEASFAFVYLRWIFFGSFGCGVTGFVGSTGSTAVYLLVLGVVVIVCFSVSLGEIGLLSGTGLLLRWYLIIKSILSDPRL